MTPSRAGSICGRRLCVDRTHGHRSAVWTYLPNQKAYSYGFDEALNWSSGSSVGFRAGEAFGEAA